MAAVGKPLNVCNLTPNKQRGIRADARHGLKQPGLRVRGRLGFEALTDLTDLGGQMSERPKIAVQCHPVTGAH